MKISYFLTFLIAVIISNVSLSQVVMNEAYSRGIPTDPDWIEIFNNSETSLDITGYKIYDSGGLAGTKPKKLFPAGSVIPAKGFLLIVTDDSDASGFGISSGGETVWLENASGTLIDSLVIMAMSETQSCSRYPDGGTAVLVDLITKGITNNRVLMNETYSRGVPTDPDWIEIFNPSSASLDITGYKIYDNGGQAGTKPKKLFPAGSIIPSKGFLVIVTDDADASGFGISSGGEKVWFEDANGVLIDSVQIAAMDTNQSFGRNPDGAFAWMLLSPRTPGSSNVLTDLEDEVSEVKQFKLNQNYPNPFNPTTTVSYSLNVGSFVSLKVFDILGNEVLNLFNKQQDAGDYKIIFDGKGLSSGVYIVRLEAGTNVNIIKMNLIK
ncbi:MAG: T9SS type A sorting domain-containing protein [Ignavibacteriales bacterium]|jgi:hypothetical protein|nr:lamin tail domain-containing protein [Ignavibacteriaceae bacterium]NLH60744.1 T9SS type A sorting domain-containing protein [Ignavibacteriales bacterium]HPO56049.1 lamin tail domain-containing protein [Ignavibacteriaceae bacterium]